MAAVHIGIRHQDNLMVAQLADIKVIPIALGKTAAKGINHGFYLCIGKNLIH